MNTIVAYLIFGGLTTLLNIVAYYVGYNIIGIPNVIANVIAWFLGVIFAFVTNKLWVFGSKKTDFKTLLHETTSFVGCRLATGIFDVIVMYVTVDLLKLNSTVCKIVSNLFVIMLNYVASKFVIFIRK